jgi:hypothetical protein
MTRLPPFGRESIMNEPVNNSTSKSWINTLVPIAFIVAWIAVQAFVLPRLGIGT